MDDEEDGFADLVAAMNAEVYDGTSSTLEKPVEIPVSSLPETESSAVSQSTTQSLDMSSTADMLQRIKQLEAELAQQKSLNSHPSRPSPQTPSQQKATSSAKNPTLTDLDYNVFTSKRESKDENPVMVEKSAPQRSLKLSDIGLSESSEDEDADFAPNLSREGRDLKRKLALRKEEEEEEEEQLCKKSRVEVLSAKSPFVTFSAPSPASQAPSALSAAKWKSKVVETCAFSGIRIANPTMSAETVKNIFGDKRMCKLSQLPVLQSQLSNRTEWGTVGVLVQKVATKQAANGKTFSIWRMSDLQDTVHLTTLFLFGDAHTEGAKVQVRGVVALLGPSLMPKKEGKDDMAVSITSPRQLLEMGFAEDMGVCKGRTKSLVACTNLVNRGKAEYCVFHLQNALSAVSSLRMELQSNFSGVQPKTSKIKEAANNFFYGGKMFSFPKTNQNTPKNTSKNSAEVKKPTVVSREAQLLIDEARDLVKVKMTEEERRTLDVLTKKNSQLNQLVVVDGPGARNLVRSATKRQTECQPVKFLSPMQLFKNHKTAMAELLASQKKTEESATTVPPGGAAVTPGGVTVKSVVSLGGATVTPGGATVKSVVSLGGAVGTVGNQPTNGREKFTASPVSVRTNLAGTTICLDDEDDIPRGKSSTLSNTKVCTATPRSSESGSSLTPSQIRALEKLKESGKKIEKSDPNRMSTGLSAHARERIQDMNVTNIGTVMNVMNVGNIGTVTNVGKKVPTEGVEGPSKARVCNLQEDPEIQALLNEYSQHDDLCRLNEIDYMDEYFKRSAAKEGLEEAMENTKEMECAVVTCKKCKYTAASLSERCFKERHEHFKHKATKKFFQCRKCSKRKQSFNAIMPTPCKGCGMQNFQRCGMLAYERKAPKLDSEILHLRGEESSKFVESCDD